MPLAALSWLSPRRQSARIGAERRAAETLLGAQRELLARATATLDAERERVADLQRRQAALRQTLGEIATTIETGQLRQSELIAAAESACAAVAAADHALAALAQQLDKVRADLEGLRGQRARCDEQITAAQRSHGELQARFDALTRLARSFEGTFAGVRAAMQWAERERRSGFVLVSALLRVPSELETAIEVALGSRIQQIVVDQWSDAEAAIAQLKRSGAGRATFLPLDTLRVGRRLVGRRARPAFVASRRTWSMSTSATRRSAATCWGERLWPTTSRRPGAPWASSRVAGRS